MNSETVQGFEYAERYLAAQLRKLIEDMNELVVGA